MEVAGKDGFDTRGHADVLMDSRAEERMTHACERRENVPAQMMDLEDSDEELRVLLVSAGAVWTQGKSRHTVKKQKADRVEIKSVRRERKNASQTHFAEKKKRGEATAQRLDDEKSAKMSQHTLRCERPSWLAGDKVVNRGLGCSTVCN